MKWLLVDKTKTIQPVNGTYRDWKGILREEGRHQCVYCAINETRFGGLRNFHVEHYKPRKHFTDLVNSIGNLFYICAICNSFKGSDWPGDPVPDWSNTSYPDPSKMNYADYLSVGHDYHVASESMSGRYIIERLYLNRAQLVHARALDDALRNILHLKDELARVIDRASPEIRDRLILCLLAAVELLGKLNYVPPYEPDEIRRER